jgi:hypothetical protein
VFLWNVLWEGGARDLQPFVLHFRNVCCCGEQHARWRTESAFLGISIQEFEDSAMAGCTGEQ